MRHLAIYALLCATLCGIPCLAAAQWRPPTRSQIESAGRDGSSESRADDAAARDRSAAGQTFPRSMPAGSESSEAVPTVALMLPLEDVPAGGNDFSEFYQGSLLALEELKAAGHSLNVNLYDTAGSPERVFETVIAADFADTDLIIGPIFEDEASPALQYAEAFGIPVVSPLASFTRLDGGMLYQMAPDPSTKYDKLHDLFNGEKNVILVSSEAGNNAEFEREITAELRRAGLNYGHFTIPASVRARSVGGRPSPAEELTALIGSLIDWNRENVFVVLAGSELALNAALPTVSSSFNKAVSTRSRKATITVVGNSRWASYTNIDRSLFFQLNVRFVTNYYINRSVTAPMARFEERYLEAYGALPTRAAYRGYDAVALFAGALFEPGFSFDHRLARIAAAFPGTPYRFVTMPGRRSHVNDQWSLVRFSDDYNVTVQ